MSKKRTRKGKASPSHVFETDGTNLDELPIDEFTEETLVIGYDPIAITDKTLVFGMALTGIPLYGYQKQAAFRIIHSIVAFEGETVTLLWCRQSGKSETLAFCIVTLTVLLPILAKILPDLDQFKDGFHVGLFAPQSDQVVTTYQRAMTRISSENATLILDDDEIGVSLDYGAKYVLSNGSTLTGQTAGKTSKIESKTYDLVIIEEAQELESFIIEKSIEPMVTATAGTIVKCGTTGLIKNDFWYEIQRNVVRNRKIVNKRLRMHFEFDYIEVFRQKKEQYAIDKKRFHLNYEKIVKKVIAKRGLHSETFKLSYALIWSLETGMLITDKEWISLINKKKGFKYTVDPEWKICAGLDIAKDSASTVLTIGRVLEQEFEDIPKKEILRFIELHGENYEIQHRVIMQALEDYNVSCLAADYTGVGRPVVDRLQFETDGWVHINPYTFTRASKSDMWMALRSDIDAKRLTIPANKNARATEEYKKCEDQLKSMQKYYSGSDLVADKSPGNFDDYGDSIGLFIIAANEIMEEEETYDINIIDDNPFFNNSGIHGNIKKNSW
jgi:hypothetical protein